MEKLTKIVALLAAVAMFVMIPGVGTLTASAEGAKTYSIGFVEGQGWRFQETADFDPSEYHRELYYLYEGIKDGDIVVVQGVGATEGLGLDFKVRLSNLTILNASAIVLAGATAIDEVYVAMGSTVAVNADVTNAYVYDNCYVTFNKNVKNLEIIAPVDVYNSLGSSEGTIDHVKCYYDGEVFYEVYNVAAGKFRSEQTELKTDAKYYSATPGAVSAAASSASQAAAGAGEYDDVPKTGESYTVFFLLGAAVLCLAGSRRLRRA